MLRRLLRHPAWLFSGGLGLGLLVGIGMLFGALAATQFTSQPRLHLPETLLQAVATNSADTIAVATGEISEGVEGVFLLDFLTGELRCWVVNPRTYALGGMFRHNVMADLGAEQGKATKYLIVTGKANFRQTGGNVQRTDSIVYVVNATTGAFAAYSMPWNRNAAAFGAAQAAPMVLIGTGGIRDLNALKE